MNPDCEEEKESEGLKKKFLHFNEFQYVPGKQTQFFSTYEPEYVFTKLVEYLKEHKFKPEFSDTHFKLKIEKERMPDIDIDQDEDEDAAQTQDSKLMPVERVQMSIEIKKVDDSTFCVDFTRKKGSSWLFFEQYNCISDYLSEYNDTTYNPTTVQ